MPKELVKFGICTLISVTYVVGKALNPKAGLSVISSILFCALASRRVVISVGS